MEPDAVDAVRFERLVGQARNDEDPRRVRLLREALALWRGAAMQDVGLQDSAAFDAAVTRLEGLRLTAMEDRFDAEISLGHGAELVTELTDLVAAHPVRERLVAALMRALAATGRDTEALLVYERTREALADALGVDPSPELSALHVALLRGELGRREENRKTNLRAELTSFVGKDADVAAVRELVAEHRLTTLIGPGGSGKTRLATETARTLLGDLPDGAWLVELAAIGADGDVAQATLAALGLRDALLGEAPDAEPTDRLIAAIREREMLLILDNCEHVIESAAAFAHRVLGECRRLRILATSREPLGITGEALWPVAPLALPAGTPPPARSSPAPAVRLLRDRAGAVRKDLATDAHTLSTMARVCRALDGMPLAIELAAARLRTMSLDQLADRLDDRFRLLTGGSRTALPRHRTLRAVIDWSWELLTDAERMVLRRLSVFSGGASLEAAERVCAGDAVEPGQVLELLTALTEKSLVVAEGDRRAALPDARHDQGVRRAAARGGGGIGSGAPCASRLLHRTRRDRGAASSPRRATGMACHARGRARQHRRRDARCARGRRGAGGDAARRGRRLVLVARRAQGRGQRADHGGHRHARRGDRRDPGDGVRVRRDVRDLRAGRRAPGGGVDPRGVRDQPAQSSVVTRRLGSSPRWNACCRRRTRSCPRGNRCSPTRTPGYARWPGCSSARCGSCSARTGGMRTRTSRRRSPSSARSANGGGSRSP